MKTLITVTLLTTMLYVSTLFTGYAVAAQVMQIHWSEAPQQLGRRCMTSMQCMSGFYCYGAAPGNPGVCVPQ